MIGTRRKDYETDVCIGYTRFFILLQENAGDVEERKSGAPDTAWRFAVPWPPKLTAEGICVERGYFSFEFYEK